jgi:hypothetical protein
VVLYPKDPLGAQTKDLPFSNPIHKVLPSLVIAEITAIAFETCSSGIP